MRDARYVRLISWTLQSGSEQYIYPCMKNNDYGIANFNSSDQFRNLNNYFQSINYFETIQSNNIIDYTDQNSSQHLFIEIMWEYKSDLCES
jgi:hypothetical protein